MLRQSYLHGSQNIFVFVLVVVVALRQSRYVVLDDLELTM